MNKIEKKQNTFPLEVQCNNCSNNFSNTFSYTSYYLNDYYLNDQNFFKNLFTTTYCIKCGMWNVCKSIKYSNGEERCEPIYPIYKEEKIENLPKNSSIYKIYNDIQTMSHYKKWSALIILSRVLIMHIAEEQIKKIDEKNEKIINKKNTFEFYIRFLAEKKLLNKDLLEGLTIIREVGNDLNHNVAFYDSENEKIIKEQAKICLGIVRDVLNYLYKYKNYRNISKDIKKNQTKNN